MTRTSAMYGWKNVGIDEIAQALEQRLGIDLEARSGLFFGDYYGWDDPVGGELILQENFLEDDGDLSAPEHPEHRVLLHASLSDASAHERIVSVAGADLLKGPEPA